MKIFIQSFGCSKNLVDSEKLVGLLNSAGHEIIQSTEDEKADFAIINTCSFIEDAVKENVNAVLSLEEFKAHGNVGGVIVAGCLFNRYGDDLKKEFPNVDLFVKSEDWISILRFLGGKPPLKENGLSRPQRGVIGGTASRYLKIMEGCDSCCSYCTIPSIRGNARSVPIADLVREANELCEQGAKEICIIGQDPTLYGKDFDGKLHFVELLSEIEKNTPSDVWIRLLYLHPNRVTRELIDYVIDSEKIVNYLDIPIQHIDAEILRTMNRGSESPFHIEKIFRYARERDPLFALRTTLMVGFPGETDEQFKRLLDFMEEAKIDRLGAFAYSPEEGTKAALMPNQVANNVKKKRLDKLMKLQAKISEQRQSLFVEKNLKILVETIDAQAKIAQGRSYRDAPEVDGLVEITLSPKDMKKIKIGNFANAKISGYAKYDLFGERK